MIRNPSARSWPGRRLRLPCSVWICRLSSAFVNLTATAPAREMTRPHRPQVQAHVITPAIAVNRVKNTPSCGVSETEAVKQPKGVKQTIVEEAEGSTQRSLSTSLPTIVVFMVLVVVVPTVPVTAVIEEAGWKRDHPGQQQQGCAKS